MSAFSFTAPFVTEEEERLERDALTAEERQQIQSDIFGTNEATDKPSQSLAQQKFRVKALEQALLNMANDDKIEIVQAQEQNPTVFERETNLVKFLYAEDGHVENAAKRIVRYWKLRKKLFGEQRAFLPMALNGAIRDDVALLSLGLILVLPPDSHGRGVLFWDRTRFTTAVAPRDAMLRCLFYVMHCLGHDHDDYVAITNARGFDLYRHVDRILTKTIFEMVASFPTKCKCIRLPLGPGSSSLSMVLPVVKYMAGKSFVFVFNLIEGQIKKFWRALSTMD